MKLLNDFLLRGVLSLSIIVCFGCASTNESSEAIVVDRAVSYNRSLFGSSSAIATDKVALMPGQRASFLNYTSYHRGINGVIVDVKQLATEQLEADDFEFRIGNDLNVAGWLFGPEQPESW